MMNVLNICQNGEFSKVRIFEIENEVWFIGKDICNYFGDTNHNRTLARVDATDKRYIEIEDALGRKQKAIAVNESGMYSILFTMQPQKANNDGVADAYPIEVQERIDKLKRFKHWVTSEVLPSIRKHGAYMTQEFMQKVLDNPDFLIQLATKLKEEQEARKKLEAKLKEDEPHAILGRAITTAKTSILVGDLAKILNQNGVDIGAKRLFEWMRNNGYLVKRKGTDWNMPTQRSMDLELFEVKESVRIDGNGCNKITRTTKVTGKGQEYFANRFLSKKAEEE